MTDYCDPTLPTNPPEEVEPVTCCYCRDGMIDGEVCPVCLGEALVDPATIEEVAW